MWTFYTYGIKLDKVINQQKHEKMVRELHMNSSKYPPAFNIDVHIDDSMGVEMEGIRFNFRTIIISEDNRNWTDDILEKVLYWVGSFENDLYKNTSNPQEPSNLITWRLL